MVDICQFSIYEESLDYKPQESIKRSIHSSPKINTFFFFFDPGELYLHFVGILLIVQAFIQTNKLKRRFISLIREDTNGEKKVLLPNE